ncbi:MAG TPA: hypothetical protein DIT07_14930, partial [Sphingobacteriaceae bacterium]|nr:hypothetical protein [Sphingobacteriaceae bacterium]
MFELNFRDERYLPFEGAGAISEWKIELTEAEELRQFDYYSISDVILHMSYTAREEAILKTPAIDNLKTILSDETKGKIFPRLISLKNDFPDEFHTMRSDVSTENVAKEFKITKLFFPYLSNNYEIKFKSCSFYKKDGSVVTEITGAAASDIIDDNWVLSLNYNPITIK